MTPLARRLGLALPLTAAGAAGVLAWVDRAIAAGCREWRPEVVRGGGPLLDRTAWKVSHLLAGEVTRNEWSSDAPYSVAIFDYGTRP